MPVQSSDGWESGYIKEEGNLSLRRWQFADAFPETGRHEQMESLKGKRSRHTRYTSTTVPLITAHTREAFINV